LISQKVNKYSKKLRKKKAFIIQPARAGLKPVRHAQTDFIHHPAGFPLDCKRIWFGVKEESLQDESGNIGLIFESHKYIKPGSTIEIVIPLRNGEEKFRGKVVLIRNLGDYYEVGLWLSHRADASRARIVEQICHIETYLQAKKYRDGPYTINRERIAEEWITKYAASVPSI